MLPRGLGTDTMHFLKGELEVLALDVFLLKKFELVCMSYNTLNSRQA